MALALPVTMNSPLPPSDITYVIDTVYNNIIDKNSYVEE